MYVSIYVYMCIYIYIYIYKLNQIHLTISLWCVRDHVAWCRSAVGYQSRVLSADTGGTCSPQAQPRKFGLHMVENSSKQWNMVAHSGVHGVPR